MQSPIVIHRFRRFRASNLWNLRNLWIVFQGLSDFGMAWVYRKRCLTVFPACRILQSYLC